MHREPTPKAQAAILRQVFADKGVALANRQTLDIVARLHGHADWHVMSKVVEPTPAVPVAVSPAAAKPQRRTRPRPAADGLLKCYSFDGIAYVESREEMARLEDRSYTCTTERWAAVEDRARALGFTCVGAISVSEDDGQDDDDIKVFVNVELYGRCALQENDDAPEKLAAILDELSAPLCTEADGTVLADPSEWQVLSIDDSPLPDDGKLQTFVFEAPGYVTTRAALETLPNAHMCPANYWEGMKGSAARMGVTGVGNIDICEDDGQGDENIKVYFCVRLHGLSVLPEGATVPTQLKGLLDMLSLPLRKLWDRRIEVADSGWELSTIEPYRNSLSKLYP